MIYDQNSEHKAFRKIEDRDYNENWYIHKERVRQLLKQGLPGMIVGCLAGISMCVLAIAGVENASILDAVLFCCLVIPLYSFILAGVPYGWSLINRIIGNWVIFGNLIVVIAFFIFKFGFSFILGITVYPIVLIYNLIHSQKSRRKIRITWAAIAASIWLYFRLLGVLITHRVLVS